MVAVPPASPVTTPAASTVAIELSVLHDPLASALLSVMVVPEQKLVVLLVIAGGRALTVTGVVTVQPLPRE